MIKVTKFGGSSLASAQQMEKVGSIIRSDPDRKYIIPSAPGKRFSDDTKVTDMLYRCYDAASEGEDIDGRIAEIAARYQEIIDGLHIDLDLEGEFALMCLGYNLTRAANLRAPGYARHGDDVAVDPHRPDFPRELEPARTRLVDEPQRPCRPLGPVHDRLGRRAVRQPPRPRLAGVEVERRERHRPRVLVQRHRGCVLGPQRVLLHGRPLPLFAVGTSAWLHGSTSVTPPSPRSNRSGAFSLG